jgi:hypothetical protein
MPHENPDPSAAVTDGDARRVFEFVDAAAGLAALTATLADPGAQTAHDGYERDRARRHLLNATFAAPEALIEQLWTERSARAGAFGSLLGQLAAAAGGAIVPWAEQAEEVLLAQGAASGGMADFIADQVAPSCPGLEDRLRAGGAILDVGAGTGAITTGLANRYPQATVTGIDVAERPIGLACSRLASEPADVRNRVRFLVRDVRELNETGAYDLIGLPTPFLADGSADAACEQCVAALREGGWLMQGVNPPAPSPTASLAQAWLASLLGGSVDDVAAARARATRLGLSEPLVFAPAAGGPVLVAAQRTA